MYQRFWKRLIDILLSGCGILVLIPVYLVIAVAVKLDDPGPVLFRQKRVGIHKSHFHILKFRTMKMCTPRDMPTHLLEDPEQLEAFRAHVEELGYTFMEMSAATHQGTRQLVQRIGAQLAELPPVIVYEPEYVPRPPQIDTSEPLSITREDDTWLVEGPWLQRLMANINFSDYESRMYFDKMLRQSGLFDQLEEMGIEDGHFVSMYDLEFEYQK